MNRNVNIKWLAMVGLALALSAGNAAAGSDHERARRAVEAGRIVPLSEALAKVEALYEGNVLEVELEDDDNDDSEEEGSGPALIYEIKLLTPQGNVLKLELDGITLEILQVRGRGIEAARRR